MFCCRVHFPKLNIFSSYNCRAVQGLRQGGCFSLSCSSPVTSWLAERKQELWAPSTVRLSRAPSFLSTPTLNLASTGFLLGVFLENSGCTYPLACARVHLLIHQWYEQGAWLLPCIIFLPGSSVAGHLDTLAAGSTSLSTMVPHLLQLLWPSVASISETISDCIPGNSCDQ